MSVYLTRNMMDRMNQVSYPSCSNYYEIETKTTDHWQKLFMESENSIKLSEAMICRICGKDGCTPITEKINEYVIHLAIEMLTNVTIKLEDSLPKYICSECIGKLHIALDFKKTCVASDMKFKKIINPMGDPARHSYPYSKNDFQLILHNLKLRKMKREDTKLKIKQNIAKPKTSEVKEYKCTSCEISFDSKEELTEHRRSRSCMRRACDICGQLVVSIKEHKRQIHKQARSHKCPSCPKEFPILARLKNHMMVHTDTFNFFCDLCPYKCKHKYYLVMHMRTHTGEKPYKCQQCPATFVNPSNLNKHKLTHQEKQFKCTLCEKAFRTNAGLREHHEAAHMNIKHSCNYCGRDFCYRSDLRKHEIRNHNRSKRDYIGGEPTYKQVERLQKMHEPPPLDHDQNKWHEVMIGPQIIQTTYINNAPNQAIYFSDVSGMMQPQPLHQMAPVPPQTVEITLPELTMKKDDGKISFETHQIQYY